MAAKTRKRSYREEIFCVQYAEDCNATRAALEAGYSPRTAAAQGSRLLKKRNVIQRIEELLSKKAQRAEKKADDILAETDLIATSDIGDILDFSGDEPRLHRAKKIPKHARRCIASIKVKRRLEKREDGEGFDPVEIIEFRLWDKVAALRLAAQLRGMLKDKVEVSGKDGAPIQVIEITKVKEKV